MGQSLDPINVGGDDFARIAGNAYRAALAAYIHDMLGELSDFLPDAATLNVLLTLAKVEAQHIRDNAKFEAANDGRDRHLADGQAAHRPSRRRGGAASRHAGR